MLDCELLELSLELLDALFELPLPPLLSPLFEPPLLLDCPLCEPDLLLVLTDIMPLESNGSYRTAPRTSAAMRFKIARANWSRSSFCPACVNQSQGGVHRHTDQRHHHHRQPQCQNDFQQREAPREPVASSRRPRC